MEIAGIEEYKGYRAIYPPEEKSIIGACWSCNGDVNMAKGFVNITTRKYMCLKCALSGFNSTILEELLKYSQEKNRKITGKYSRF